MGIKGGTVEFPLTRGLDYKRNGRTETASHVVLQEPGMDHVKFYLRLKSMLTRSQIEFAKHAGEIQESIGEVVKPLAEEVDRLESETDATHEMVSIALQASDTVDIGQFIGTFEKMVCVRSGKAIVMVDDKQVMTRVMWNNLKPDDAFNMSVRWCTFFGMPSQGGEKNILDQPLESHTLPTEA